MFSSYCNIERDCAVPRKRCHNAYDPQHALPFTGLRFQKAPLSTVRVCTVDICDAMKRAAPGKSDGGSLMARVHPKVQPVAGAGAASARPLPNNTLVSSAQTLSLATTGVSGSTALPPPAAPLTETEEEAILGEMHAEMGRLFDACRDGDAGVVAALLRDAQRQYGAAFAVDLPDATGVTPLEGAIAGAHVDVVKELVAANASLILNDGRSALDLAVAANRPSVLECLLALHRAAVQEQQQESEWLVVEEGPGGDEGEAVASAAAADSDGTVVPAQHRGSARAQVDGESAVASVSTRNKPGPPATATKQKKKKLDPVAAPSLAGATGVCVYVCVHACVHARVPGMDDCAFLALAHTRTCWMHDARLRR